MKTKGPLLGKINQIKSSPRHNRVGIVQSNIDLNSNQSRLDLELLNISNINMYVFNSGKNQF